MKCPHCKKELFGKGHNVRAFYEEPKELTIEEKNKQLQVACKLAQHELLAITTDSYALAAIDQALKATPTDTPQDAQEAAGCNNSASDVIDSPGKDA